MNQNLSYILIIILISMLLTGCNGCREDKTSFIIENSTYSFNFNTHHDCEKNFFILNKTYHTEMESKNIQIYECERKLDSNISFINNVIQWDEELYQTWHINYPQAMQTATQGLIFGIAGLVLNIIVGGIFYYGEKEKKAWFTICWLGICIICLYIIGSSLWFRWFQFMF